MSLLDELNLNDDEMRQLRHELLTAEDRTLYREHEAAIAAHQEYVGKCFKEPGKETYIKVVSPRSQNEYWAECLIVEFPVKMYPKRTMRKKFSHRCAYGSIEYEGVRIEPYPLFCKGISRGYMTKTVMDGLEQVSDAKFWQKVAEYNEELRAYLIENKFK